MSDPGLSPHRGAALNAVTSVRQVDTAGGHQHGARAAEVKSKYFPSSPHEVMCGVGGVYGGTDFEN